MKLLALNDEWAVFSPENASDELDSFGALRDLVSVKTYAQLIGFLEKHACNTVFARDCDSDFDDTFRSASFIWRNEERRIELKGDLQKEIDKHFELDYLDKLVLEDLEGELVYQLYLPELLDFQQIVCRFLRYAAVALGAQPEDSMFEVIDSGLLFGEDWIKNNLGCEVGDLVTLGFPESFIGAGHNAILPDYAFDGGIFDHLSGYSRYQLVINSEREYGKYTDGFPFSIDDVIYQYAEITTQVDDDCYDSEFYLTVSFMDDVDEALARKLLAGRAIEALMNSGLDFIDQRQFVMPTHDDAEFDGYTFDVQKGFSRNTSSIQEWWVDALFHAAFDLVVSGGVSLCPVCKAPVLIRDRRGRKAKQVCSDTCKTKASVNRREAAYRCAMSGVLLEEAIESIGREYACSVKRWYAEVESIRS